MDELSLKTDRRRLMQMLAAGAAGATLPLGLASPAFAADKRIAMVVKNLGNSYFDACRDGAKEAAKEARRHRDHLHRARPRRRPRTRSPSSTR